MHSISNIKFTIKKIQNQDCDICIEINKYIYIEKYQDKDEDDNEEDEENDNEEDEEDEYNEDNEDEEDEEDEDEENDNEEDVDEDEDNEDDEKNDPSWIPYIHVSRSNNKK